MKLLILNLVAFFSISLLADRSTITCEMVSKMDSLNKLSVFVDYKDGYGFSQSDDVIDNLYAFGVEVHEGDLQVVIVDDNDEVGSFSCDLNPIDNLGTICSEPIYSENEVYNYDLTCRVQIEKNTPIVCNVENYKDAIECIKKDADKRFAEGEIPHSVGVTKYHKGKKAFHHITSVEATKTYVGVVQAHYDEDIMAYYEISKGKAVSPVLVKSFNIVDMYDDERNASYSVDELSLYIKNIKDFHN